MVLRDGPRPTYDIVLRSVASRRHPLQDGVDLATLPRGGALLAVSDATTNARGVAPEDATQVVMQRLQDTVRSYSARGLLPLPMPLLRALHNELRAWLEAHPGSACGVAQSIVVLNSSGHVQAASVGDTRVFAFKPGRLFRKPRLIELNPPEPGRDPRVMRSALGQMRSGALLMEVAEVRLDVGDLLLVASDGGLPEVGRGDLLDGLQAHAKDRRHRLASLESLCIGLDARAQRIGAYDDDRTIAICERL
ncbi:MAG: hypothetical protein ABL900_07205 [Burkholderiaceae bacterium]